MMRVAIECVFRVHPSLIPPPPQHGVDTGLVVMSDLRIVPKREKLAREAAVRAGVVNAAASGRSFTRPTQSFVTKLGLEVRDAPPPPSSAAAAIPRLNALVGMYCTLFPCCVVMGV
jgi:hypothetical protein